jgi:CheY-like chemotaxis protein
VNLSAIVQQVLDLTRPRWRDQPQERGVFIELRTELAGNLPGVAGVEGEIRDALTNLVFNAVDAMPGGGCLTLRTRTVTLQKEVQGREPGVYLHLEVSDTGTGMDEETRRRCLEPFFTTKGERGTGLGLAMVYGMAQRHDAEIEIESELGKGTTVRIVFPRSAAADAPSIPAEAPQAGSALRVLVVDDDPLLIKALRDTLESDGHDVTAVHGGQAGIDAFDESIRKGEPFAIVVTDLGMPYVDGRKVSAAIKAASPSTPVVLLTGWGQRMIAERDIPPHVDRVLKKPPRLQDLRTAFSELTAQGAQLVR